MTKKEILAMKPGTELNKLVAEEVLGMKVIPTKYLAGHSSVDGKSESEIYEECYARR